MVYLLIRFLQIYGIYLISFISFFFFFFFCLLKRFLKGNKYFERIKHILENWRGDTKMFLFKSIYFIVKII